MTAAAEQMQLLRAGERAAVPWRNGGGVTSQVAAHPPCAGLEDFDWRVSCAQVERAGPFSRFPGVDRTIAILAGELSLEVEGQAARVLTPESAPWEFPGDVATAGGPLAGTVHDLNVMTRRGRCRATVQRCLVEQRARFTFTATTTVVLAAAPLVAKAQELTLALARLDALLVRGALECEFSSVVPGACFYRIEVMPG